MALHGVTLEGPIVSVGVKHIPLISAVRRSQQLKENTNDSNLRRLSSSTQNLRNARQRHLQMLSLEASIKNAIIP